MNFDGNLGSLFLPNLLQMLHRDGVTGILRIKHPDARLQIYFERGNIIYASGIGKEVQLVQLMAKKRLLSAEQHAVISQFIPDDQFQLGSYLLENKLLPLATWAKYTKIMVDQTLLKAFLLEDADFKFEGRAISIPDVYQVRINMMQLILDITRKVDEWNFIRKQIPDKNIVFEVCDVFEDEKKSIRFSRSEWSVLSKIDGKKTVEEIIMQCETDELTVYKILYSFISSGLIKRVENVYLNHKGDFIDYEGIIVLYIDLFRIIERTFKNEIGANFYIIYARCLDAVNQRVSQFLEGFDPFIGETRSISKNITARMAKFKNFAEGKETLLESLNRLLRTMLNAMEDVVGKRLKEATIQELMMAISFVGKYQAASDINKLVLRTLREGEE
ncbi:MAG: DUF4388 domain-containing protein [Deltaproteobacteria bacterium]|nr:DUF4388 domain-containing protein [Deltaproteobacteria bacterium]